MSSSSPSASEAAVGESMGMAKSMALESEAITDTSSTTTTTTSNGSMSKDEARVHESIILASDTPESQLGETVAAIFSNPEIVPESISPPIFGRSATSLVGTENNEKHGAGIVELAEVQLPTRVDSDASVKIIEQEPELIVLSSSSSVIESPARPAIDSSNDDLHLHLDSSQSDFLDESREGEASTKPKYKEESPPKADAGVGSGKIERSKEIGAGDDDEKQEDESAAAPIEEANEEDIILKKSVGQAEQPMDTSETAAETSGQELQDVEEKDDQEEEMEEDAETPQRGVKAKRGRPPGRGRGRGRGRGGRGGGRGRVSRSSLGRSPRDIEERETPEHSTEDPETGEEKADQDAERKDEAKDATEEPEEQQESPPKKRARRRGVDAILAAEGKAQEEETPESEKSETRRVLRNRFQSPAGSGSEGTPRRRRNQTSTSSGDEHRDSDAEKSVRPKRGAAKTRSPESSPTPSRRQGRQKRSRLSSDEQHHRSASSDSEAKEEPRTRRTRGGDTPMEVDEPSKPKRTPAARGRKPRGGGASSGRKKADDPFDFDDSADPAPAGPFRRVNVSKSNFGNVTFTKAQEKSSEKNKYTVTSKAADLKRQDTTGSTDTIIKPGKTTITHSLKPELKRQISPEKSGSSGNMADVSSFGSSVSSGQKADRRQASVKAKRYSEEPEEDDDEADDRYTAMRSSQSRLGASRSSSSTKQGSVSLFSDPDMSGDSSGRRGRGVKRSIRDDLDDGNSSGDDSANRSRKRRRRTADQLTPKPKEPEVKNLSQEEQLNADFPSQSTATLLPGARVLARWKDKCFYAAIVLQDEGLGRYKVRYCADGAVKDTPRPDLVAVSSLKEGDVLMVRKIAEGGEEDLEPITIKRTPSPSNSEEWFGGVFEVDNEVQECSETVSWETFIIDVDQTKHYVTTRINKAAQDITADNITDKKERRRTRTRAEQHEDEQEEEEPKDEPEVAPRTRRTSPRSPRPARTTTNTPRSPPSRRSGASSGTPSDAGPSAKRRRTGEASFGRVGKVGSSTSRRQPPPQIFEGFYFVLTSANRRAKENDSSEEEKPSTITFNKKHVRQLIEDHGGQVVDEFSQAIDLSRCFLIADTHYRTHKYLSALARAVPCVKHTWIHESCAEKQLLDHVNYMLAAGYSLESDKILPWHNKCPDLLADKSVLVYTENRPNNPGSLDFVQIWAPLVKCMGANVIETAPDAGTEHVDILLTDATCSPAQLQAAESRGAKAVSSEWLIQAIITGRQPRPDGHKKYEYSYLENPTTGAAAAVGGGGSSANENPAS